MLEEIGLPYEPHLVDIGKATSARRNICRSIPTARFPPSSTRTDRAGSPLALFESGAILLYLAEKTGQAACPATPRRATRPSSGCSSRWPASARCSARWVSSISLPVARSPRQASAANAIVTSRSACSQSLEGRLASVTGSWADLHHCRHRHARLGAQPRWILPSRPPGRVRALQGGSRVAGTLPGPAGRAAGPHHSRPRCLARGPAGVGPALSPETRTR